MQSVAKGASFVAAVDFYGEFLLPSNPGNELLTVEALCWLGSVGSHLADDHLFFRMDINTEKDDFDLGGLVFGCYGFI